MRLLKIIQFFRRHLKRVVYTVLGVMALIVVLDAILVDKSHAHTWMEKGIPGFWAIFGLIGCILLILLSKWFGHLGIMTREDYYDE